MKGNVLASTNPHVSVPDALYAICLCTICVTPPGMLLLLLLPAVPPLHTSASVLCYLCLQ